MAQSSKIFDLKFDNGVLKSKNIHFAEHSFHYGLLLTQLAIDTKNETILQNCSEDAFVELFNDIDFGNINLEAKVELVTKIFSQIGFGKIEILTIGKDTGELKLTRSLFDEGWLMKWGKIDRSVNYIGFGFISAMFNCLFNAPRNSYKVKELARISSGDLFSHLIIYKV